MSNEIKRHFYNNVHYEFDKNNKTIKLLPEFHKQLKNQKLWSKFGFKKVGGSSVGDVLLKGMFNSEFAAFCRLTWLGMPILDRKYVDAGIAIEPKVIELIETKLQLDYQDDLKVTTYKPEEHDFDLFKGQDTVVGGIPDGYIDKLSTLIEIKTTNEKNYVNWTKFGIPDSYKRQAQLYAYLMGVDKYVVVAAFLQEDDYLNLDQFNIGNRRVKSWPFQVDKAVVEDDINRIKSWYKVVTDSGISPQYDEAKDADLLSWLKCKNAAEWLKLKAQWIDQGKLVI